MGSVGQNSESGELLLEKKGVPKDETVGVSSKMIDQAWRMNVCSVKARTHACMQ